MPKSLLVLVYLLVLWLAAGCAVGNKDLLLIEAARAGNTKKVVLLIQKGANIDSRDAEGYNAFTAASVNGHLQTIKVLRQAGAKTVIAEF
ncbi:MAG: ankyrin repeat domain-containing protein [Fibrobacteria bacterium]|nr:ankyrin repeat domain-containing protein [Fibrobacteria bacterium]